jgi:hypothetical protein
MSARFHPSAMCKWTHLGADQSGGACCLVQVVALAREVLGGNGVQTDFHVAKQFCDMEAIYTYEVSDVCSSPGSYCFAVTEAHCTFTVSYTLAVVSCSKLVGAAQLTHEQQVTDLGVLRVSPEANGWLTNSSKVLEHA